jgi:hypothetical protein
VTVVSGADEMVVMLVVEVWACVVVVVKKVDVVENVSIIAVSVNVLVTVLVEVMLTVRAFGVTETVDRVVDSTAIGNRPSYIIRVFVGAFFTELPDTFVEYFFQRANVHFCYSKCAKA